MGTLEEKFWKCFRKPWSNIYSTEMFMKMVLYYWKWELRKKELVAFQMSLVITRYPPEQLTRATTLPRYGTGLSPKFIYLSVWSLIVYKGLWYLGSWCTQPRNLGWPRAWGNTYHGISQAAGRHLGSPAVASKLRSEGGTAGACRGGRLHRAGTRTKVGRWKTLFDYLNPAY
jgi:hypothetical protein